MRMKFLAHACAVALVYILLFAGGGNAQGAPTGYTKLNTAPITGTTFNDSTCSTLGKVCSYVVSAVNNAGVEAFDPTPVTVTVTASATAPYSVTLNWNASSTAGVTYNAYGTSVNPPGGLAAVVN